MFLHVTPVSERVALAFDLTEGPVLIPRERPCIRPGLPVWVAANSHQPVDEPPQQ